MKAILNWGPPPPLSSAPFYSINIISLQEAASSQYARSNIGIMGVMTKGIDLKVEIVLGIYMQYLKLF
jgi:hypothetical protein